MAKKRIKRVVDLGPGFGRVECTKTIYYVKNRYGKARKKSTKITCKKV